MNDAQIDIFIQQNANTTDTGLIGLYFVWQPELQNPFPLWQVDEGLVCGRTNKLLE
jgi:hypothetical protein